MYWETHDLLVGFRDGSCDGSCDGYYDGCSSYSGFLGTHPLVRWFAVGASFAGANLNRFSLVPSQAQAACVTAFAILFHEVPTPTTSTAIETSELLILSADSPARIGLLCWPVAGSSGRSDVEKSDKCENSEKARVAPLRGRKWELCSMERRGLYDWVDAPSGCAEVLLTEMTKLSASNNFASSAPSSVSSGSTTTGFLVTCLGLDLVGLAVILGVGFSGACLAGPNL